MLLTITTTHRPATDLGYLLHKQPGAVPDVRAAVRHRRTSSTRRRRAERCTAALLLEVDPVGLVRGAAAAASGSLEQYVNDRPYVASSFLSVAIAQRVRHARWPAAARSGRSWPRRRSRSRRGSPVLPCRGGEALLRAAVRAARLRGRRASATPLDEQFPEWGDEPLLHRDAARRRCGCATCSTHLYVLIPVLDDDKHYWVGDDEVEKLLRHGEGWLAAHPGARADRAPLPASTSARLTREALARCSRTTSDRPGRGRGAHDAEEEAVERADQPERAAARRGASPRCKRARRARVLDLGCGEGQLLRALLAATGVRREIVGMDVSHRALEIAARAAAPRPPAAERSASASRCCTAR